MRFALALFIGLVAVSPLHAKAVKVVTPLATGVVGASQVVGTTVTLNAITQVNFAKLEAKASEKRSAANLPPVREGDAPGARPPLDEYPTLPIARMMPLIVDDKLREWGMTGGRRVSLTIELDTLKTANAGMAMLLGSTDQLAGMVSVLDADSGVAIGQFYVDVINARSGLLGLAMRGSGVREKLAEEFAKHIAKQLSGSKKPLKIKQ